MIDVKNSKINVGDTVVYMTTCNCPDLLVGKVSGIMTQMLKIDTGLLHSNGKPLIHRRWPDKVMVIDGVKY